MSDRAAGAERLRSITWSQTGPRLNHRELTWVYRPGEVNDDLFSGTPFCVRLSYLPANSFFRIRLALFASALLSKAK